LRKLTPVGGARILTKKNFNYSVEYMSKLSSHCKTYCQTFLLIIFIVGGFAPLPAQEKDQEQNAKLSSEAKRAREYSLTILGEMKRILNDYYYDQKFHGIDLKARIETAKARVKTLQYNWQMYRVLVQVLMDFDDSHTRMFLPGRSDYFEYGFGMQMIGGECFITSVKRDSDAGRQGIAAGDQILMLGKFKPNRRDLWKMIYVLYKLDPSETLELKIRKPDGSEKSLTVKAKKMTDKEFRAQQKTRQEKYKFEPFKCQEMSKEVVACKLYSFVIEKNDIDKMIKRAAKYPKFILDLRGNPGGYVSVEQYLLSHFFDREIKIADLLTKEKTETRMTRPVGDRQYKGEVAVLIDSKSASAAEVTARVLQLEKRARIYGDVSSGSVMTSIALPFTSFISGSNYTALIRVGMSVTVADVIMPDGSRLEKSGVVPDKVLLPSALGLAKKTDPVLAYAAVLFGASVSPETAGSYYFLVSKQENDEGEEQEDEDGEAK
jgi:C-terminal processing protease CtpA/Prc